MTYLRVREAAELLGVSDDSVRRWIESGELPAELDDSGRKVIEGANLAGFARDNPRRAPHAPSTGASSARNQFPGLVTKVTSDAVMAHVEMQCGPFTVVSLMSAQAVADLGLVPGSVAVASVKATMVTVQTPEVGA